MDNSGTKASVLNRRIEVDVTVLKGVDITSSYHAVMSLLSSCVLGFVLLVFILAPVSLVGWGTLLALIRLVSGR